MKVEYGKHFKVKVSRYTDEDFDSANNAVELEIKSSKPILKLAVEKAMSAMFDHGYVGFNIEPID